MCGLPFAGKSTLARQIAHELNLPVVSLDSINDERGLGFDGQAIAPQDWTETYEESYRRAERYLEAGSSVVYDATNHLRHERERLRTIAIRNNCRAIFVYVKVTAAESHRRLLENRRQVSRNDVRDDDFLLVARSFEAPEGELGVIEYDSAMPTGAWIAENL